MNKDNFADISYSRQLADMFPEAEWWHYIHPESDCELIEHKYFKGDGLCYIYAPAITILMLFEILPHLTIIKGDKFTVEYEPEKYEPSVCYTDKKLSNALCKMLIWLKAEGGKI